MVDDPNMIPIIIVMIPFNDPISYHWLSSSHCYLVGGIPSPISGHLNINQMLDNPGRFDAEISRCHPIFFSAEPHHPCEMPTRGAGYRRHLGRRPIFLTHLTWVEGLKPPLIPG